MHISDSLRYFARALNNYANLLLAIFTASYVWLTWRTLKALQRASLREPELRHLDDIKRNVAHPLIEWLDSHALQELTGSSPPIIVSNVAVPRPNAAIGERVYQLQRRLQYTLQNPKVTSTDLFSHSRRAHFPTELAQFEAFLDRVRQFSSDSLAFAKDCADEIAALTRLPRTPATDNVHEAADTDILVEICIRDTLLNKPNPEIEYNSPSLGTLHVGDGFVGRPIGKGPADPAKAWVENGIARFRDRWKQSGLRERIDGLLEEAAVVRVALQRIEFTQALPHDCEYVGGKAPGMFERTWYRLRSRLF
jgi:hypothetical protein